MDPQHRLHDEALIARFAAGDADPSEVERAEGQLAVCPDCRAIHADVQAIRASTSAEVLRVPRRPRSFRIPADELDRSRRPAWQRWLGRFGTPRFDFVPRLATVVAGLGLAVIVLGGGSAPFSFLGGPASLPGATELSGRDHAAGPSPATTAAPAESLVPAAAATPTTYDYKAAHPSASPGSAEGATSASAPPAPQGPGISPGPTAVSSGAATAASGGAVPTSGTPGPGGPATPLVLGSLLLVGGAGALILNLAARRFAAR